MLTQIKNQLKIHKAAYKLAKLPSATLNTSDLPELSEAQLQALMLDEQMLAHWEVDGQTLTGLEFPEQALGVNKGDRQAIYALIHSLKPQSVLEIGTHIGVSTAHIAMATKHYDITTAPSIDTVDIVDVNLPATGDTTPMWKAYGARKSPADVMAQLGLRERVQFHCSNSLELLSTIDKKYDFIFLDGDHAAVTVYQELPKAMALLNPRGQILLHDYYPNLKPLFSDGVVICGPCLATDRLHKETPDLVVQPLGDLPWPTKQGSNRTSLALVGRRG